MREEIENVKKEKDLTVKVFSRDTLSLVQIGTSLYGPFGVSHFNTEEEVDKQIQELSVEEVQEFDVAINHYESLIEYECKNFSLRLYKKQYILVVVDKKHPEYDDWEKKFILTKEEADMLLQYICKHTESIYFNL